MVKKAALKRRLLERDGYRCGVHVGGCGGELTLVTTTIDHIVPQNVLRTDPRVHDQLAKDEGFLQPMCQDCNSARKQGGLDVAFTCKCHNATFFSRIGRPELVISYTQGFVVRRLRISAEESPDGTHLIVWGMTKTGTIGYKPDHLGGVFVYPPPLSEGGSDFRVFRPVSVAVYEECRASGQEVRIVQVEHLDMRQIASQASLRLKEFNDRLQMPIQSILRQHSSAIFGVGRAISVAGERNIDLTLPLSLAARRVYAVPEMKGVLAGTREMQRAMASVAERHARQLSAVSREISRVLATSGMQQILAETRKMNRIMANVTAQCALQSCVVSRISDRALSMPNTQGALIGTREPG